MRAAQQHHDAQNAMEGDFSRLNAAYSTLRDPARRLRLLLTLAGQVVSTESTPIAPELGDLFLSLAAHRQKIRQWRERIADAQSGIARASGAAEKAQLEGETGKQLDFLEQEYARALDEMRTLDAVWNPADPTALARAARLQNRFLYLGRWLDEFREMLFLLSAT